MKPLEKSPKENDKLPARPDAKHSETSGKSYWANIIQSVDAPLGFYALFTLIMEAILGLVITFGGLTEPHKFFIIEAMLAIFCGIVAIVTGLTLTRPHILSIKMAEQKLKEVEQEQKRMKEAQGDVTEFFNTGVFEDRVRDVIESHSNTLQRPKALPRKRSKPSLPAIEGSEENGNE